MATGIPAAKTTKAAPASCSVRAHAFDISSFILAQVSFTEGCLFSNNSSIPVSIMNLILSIRKYTYDLHTALRVISFLSVYAIQSVFLG